MTYRVMQRKYYSSNSYQNNDYIDWTNEGEYNTWITIYPIYVQCPYCGVLIESGDIYCRYCGKQLIIEQKDEYCSKCGQKIKKEV